MSAFEKKTRNAIAVTYSATPDQTFYLPCPICHKSFPLNPNPFETVKTELTDAVKTIEFTVATHDCSGAETKTAFNIGIYRDKNGMSFCISNNTIPPDWWKTGWAFQ
jgi:hypothetical protein